MMNPPSYHFGTYAVPGFAEPGEAEEPYQAFRAAASGRPVTEAILQPTLRGQLTGLAMHTEVDLPTLGLTADDLLALDLWANPGDQRAAYRDRLSLGFAALGIAQPQSPDFELLGVATGNSADFGALTPTGGSRLPAATAAYAVITPWPRGLPRGRLKVVYTEVWQRCFPFDAPLPVGLGLHYAVLHEGSQAAFVELWAGAHCWEAFYYNHQRPALHSALAVQGVSAKPQPATKVHALGLSIDPQHSNFRYLAP